MVRTKVLLSLLSFCALLSATFGESMRNRSSRLPSLAESPVSAALGRDYPAYHARRTSSGFEFENPRHDLKVYFYSKGMQLRTGSDQWNLHFVGCGRGDVLDRAENVTPRSNLNRVEYSRASATEWYVNDLSGARFHH
jgi:hypothetical protein